MRIGRRNLLSRADTELEGVQDRFSEAIHVAQEVIELAKDPRFGLDPLVVALCREMQVTALLLRPRIERTRALVRDRRDTFDYSL